MPVSETFAALATQTGTKVLASVISSYILRKNPALASTSDVLFSGFKRYFDSTYIKCTNIKTILSDESTSLLSCHVDQTFQIGNIVLDHYDMVDDIKSGSCLTVTGTGGSGKSIFKRYLWISLLEDFEGRIPILFELKGVNDIDPERDLLDIIFYSIVDTTSGITIENFRKSVEAGEMYLLLDGFDEIISDRRRKIERQVTKLKEDHPDCRIILSSRPDERFAGWPQFKTASIEPLKKTAVISLIERADFVDQYKNTMLRRIKDGLFETHETFLTNPLLCYLMLVTVANEGAIETNRTLFYEQAFEALYYRHDLRKSGYIRSMHSNLNKNQFRIVFSYFAIRTYLNSKLDFSESEILDSIDKSKLASGIDFNSELFLKDAVESVCLLKREGAEYSYTHRSFQEYFSAICLTRNIKSSHKAILEIFAGRYYDQALSLVMEMDPDLVVTQYIIPSLEEYNHISSMPSTTIKAANFLQKTITQLVLTDRHRSNAILSFRQVGYCTSPFSTFHGAIVRLKGPLKTGSNRFFKERTILDIELDRKSMTYKAAKVGGRKSGVELAVSGNDNKIFYALLRENFDEPETADYQYSNDIEQAIFHDFISEFVDFELDACIQACDELIAAYEGRSKGLSDLIG